MSMTQEITQAQAMPAFEFSNIMVTKNDLLNLSVYIFGWLVILMVVMMYVPMPEKYAKELKEAGDDEKLKKKVMFKHLKFQNYVFSGINNTLAFGFGVYYFFAYGLIVDQWCNDFEYAMTTLQISFFMLDFVTSLFFGHNDMRLTIHHVMAVIGYGTPFLYRRYGSESIFGMFVGEFSGPFLAMREILPLISDRKLASVSRFMYSSDAKDEVEENKRAENVRTINDIIFMITFVIARTWGTEYLFYYIHHSAAPLYFKLQASGLWFLGFVWLWEIFNKASKIFAIDLFPKV